ncbi:hypothetical protein BSK56_31995 [Paenibacillus borealis]|uniref:ABC transporter ATP-binding protein n=2 Tax=Paenibacillus borealis TaxID=160799 RepID=A0ABX3GU39_PAEBO|nr:ABC transporter ATP-binding protein [Paenibacillus borealis]OMD36697.1 hypothetical protein BSK56_31995 [Paenibacillus borealis]
MYFKLLSWCVSYVWRNKKSLILSSILFSVVLGIIPYFSLIISKKFINELSLFIMSSKEIPGYSNIVILLLAQVAIQTFSTGIGYLDQYLEKKNLSLLEQKLVIEMTSKLSKIPLLTYDDPEFHNHFGRINTNISERFWSPIRSIKEFIKTVLSIGSYTFILLAVSYKLIVLCVIVTIPLFFIQSRLGKNKFHFSIEVSSLMKEIRYIYSILTDRNYAKEMRAYSLNNFFLNRWSQKYLDHTGRTLSLEKKQYIIKMSTESATSVFYIFTSVFVLVVMRRIGSLQIGDFLIVNQALNNTQTALNRLTVIYSDLKVSLLYLKDLKVFFDLEEHLEAVCLSPEETSSTEYLSLQNVTFRYPTQTVCTLKGISFSINKGEKIAIIGSNGSGKTTLIKCLLGLYKEYQGEIRIMGEDIKHMPDDRLRKTYAFIFQDFLKFPYTVKENIYFGDVDSESSHSDSRVISASTKAGIHGMISNLPEKYNTYLGNYIHYGVDFSGGQWQKTALARALYRHSDILVLDEPTASLDSRSEMEVFKELLTNSEDKTVIFISHRIASARYADKIILLKEGEIIEQGTHNELVAKHGEYYQLYSMGEEIEVMNETIPC